ncbi:MAG: alpha/beta fold hydrolase [Rhabdochlamydiaceae bacterium]|nr:alpha/beta fold hydrolase [Rhabdochlamydiaceae bacterium]
MVYKGVDRQLYFLHGFAGSPDDWELVIGLLPEYDCQSLSYPFILPSRGVLIGYSMGGRIAIQAEVPKLLISAHPGLKTEEERSARKAQEELWIEKLKTLTLQEFFQEWYAQSIFSSLTSHPNFPRIFERRLKNDPLVLLEQFKSHSLVSQKSHHRNAIFLHGQYDDTYKKLYAGIASHEIPHAGHACHLENPQATAEKIKLILNSIL